MMRNTTALVLTVCVGLAAAFHSGLETLVQVQILTRHGARTPFGKFPTDEYKDFWQDGIGELTNVGKNQMFELGQYLRQRYAGFLNATYNSREVLANSTSTYRTISSAECLLAGLYPPSVGQDWRPGFRWQPVPVFSTPLDLDYMLTTDSPCPIADKVDEDPQLVQKVKEFNDKNADLYELVLEKAGFGKPSITNQTQLMGGICDALICQRDNNLAMPSWVEPVWPRLKEFGALMFSSYTVPWVARLKTGPLLGHMIDMMALTIQGSPNQHKVYLYSSHDKTLIGLMSLLEVYNGLLTPVASALILELHRMDNDQHGIKIGYKNSTGSEEPVTLQMPDCPTPCPIKKFAALMDLKIPDDVFRECGMTSCHVSNTLKPSRLFKPSTWLSN